MLFYGFIIALISFFLYIYSIYKIELSRTIVTCIITLVAICRYEVGYDYITYQELIQSEDSEMVNYLFAPLSALLAHIAIYFHSPQLLFVLFGVPMYVLIFSTLKKYSTNYALSIIVFMGFFFYTSLSTIRQMLAVAICIYGFRYIVNRQIIKYLICITIATLTHPSAAIAIIIYWIYNIRLTTLLIGAIIALSLSKIAFKIMEQYGFYTSYIDSSKDDIEGGSLARIILLLIFIFCFIIYTYSKKNNVITRGIINIIFTGFILNFMFTAHIGSRIALFFSIYLCLLIPNIITMTKGQLKKQLYFLFYGLCIFYYFAYLLMPTIKGFTSSYLPYKLYFLQ